MRNWWERPRVVQSVADWAADTDELPTWREVNRFHEKPWDYEELFEGWAHEQGAPAGEEAAWLDGYGESEH